MRFFRFRAEPRSGSVARPWIVGAVAVLWFSTAVGGLWVMAAYERTPGIAASAPQRWPASSRLTRAAREPTLVFFAHPRCVCTRASLTELAEVLARTSHHPRTLVLFIKPSGVDAGWDDTDLWQQAAALPDTTVVRDTEGTEAAHFAAVTSGQTLLYDARGALIFRGGITGARGQTGENRGRAALIAALNGNTTPADTSVFGCSLLGPQAAPREVSE